MANHKWGKEIKVPDGFRQYRQACEKCGFTRGIDYTQNGKRFYVPGHINQRVPSCQVKE